MTTDLGRTRTGAVDLGGVTIGYRETGAPAAAPPVLLLHGLGSKASTWDRFAATWAEAGGRAIALDARGHASSSRPGEYSFELMVGDLLAFLDHHGFDRVDLVGHSMGGGVVQRFAGRFPDRVRRLVIEDAPPPAHEPPAEPVPEAPAEPPEPVDFDWRVVRPIFRQVRTPDPAWWALLPKITAPTLLVAGGPSSHVSQDRIREMADLIPDARVVEIGVGHHVHREAPDAFAGAVLPFLR